MFYLMFLNNHTIFNPIFYFLGCILMDGDHRNAPISMLFPFWRLGFRHRGFTHSLQFVVICMIIVYFIFSWWSAVSLFVGLMTHLILDAATPSGIRWIWKKRKATR